MPIIKEVYAEWKKSYKYNTFTYGELVDLSDCSMPAEVTLAIEDCMKRVKKTVNEQIELASKEIDSQAAPAPVKQQQPPQKKEEFNF